MARCLINKNKKAMDWINVNEKLPELNEEYLVVWDLKDGEHPCVTSMDFDVKRKAFTDPRGTGEPLEMSEVLFWGELPKPPKIKAKDFLKAIMPKAISIDQMEHLAYGQCVHGDNLARCPVCNPNGA